MTDKAKAKKFNDEFKKIQNDKKYILNGLKTLKSEIHKFSTNATKLWTFGFYDCHVDNKDSNNSTETIKGIKNLEDKLRELALLADFELEYDIAFSNMGLDNK